MVQHVQWNAEQQGFTVHDDGLGSNTASAAGGSLGYWVDQSEAPTATEKALAKVEFRLYGRAPLFKSGMYLDRRHVVYLRLPRWLGWAVRRLRGWS